MSYYTDPTDPDSLRDYDNAAPVSDALNEGATQFVAIRNPFNGGRDIWLRSDLLDTTAPAEGAIPVTLIGTFDTRSQRERIALLIRGDVILTNPDYPGVELSWDAMEAIRYWAVPTDATEVPRLVEVWQVVGS